MKILASSDWQVIWSNLDKCKLIVEEIIEIIKREGIDYFVHCGDLKHQINPVDVRVINFGVWMVKRISKYCPVIINKGNHDMLGMHDTSASWFPALREAGATVVEDSKVIDLEDGYKLHVVAFYRDTDELKKVLKTISRDADPRKSILIFHNEVVGCKLNTITVSKSDALTVKHLMVQKYLFALGGHIHLNQKLRGTDNAYYVGSAFAQDWGESNQRKGHVILDLSKKQYRFIESKLPRLYDPSWPGYEPPKSWKGQSVRIRVKVPDFTTNVGAYLSRQRDKAKVDYPGATVVAVPEYGDKSKFKTIIADGTDNENIKAYVEETCPRTISEEQMVSFLSYYLEQTGMYHHASQKLTITDGEARNFLCFPRLKIKYEPGITVVTGLNKDWKNRANGSGKTSYLQLPSVVLFGKTLKGQTSDRWARRHSKKPAYGRLNFVTADNRKCSVIRQRKPGKLQFIINGKDASTGTGKIGTQKAIEQVTGLTWETLTNAMFIDQSEVKKLLIGSDPVRRALFGKFLNLERFTKARVLIKKRESRVRDLLDSQKDFVTSLRGEVDLKKRFLEELPSDEEITETKKFAASMETRVRRFRKKMKLADKKAGSFKTKDLDDVLIKARVDGAKYQALANRLVDDINDMVSTRSKYSECPTCLQPVNKKLLDKKVVLMIAKKNTYMTLYKTAKGVLNTALAHIDDRRQKEDRVQQQIRDLRGAIAGAESDVAHAESKLKELRSKTEAVKRWRRELAATRKTLSIAKDYESRLELELEFLKYASTSFSPNGLPMYVAGQICPQLSSAAAKYSMLFSENEILVQFPMTEDGPDVVVSNAHGGERVTDQSVGELSLAIWIVGFALREVLQPCNVMVLDEPGDGLDAVNAKILAQGIKNMAEDVGSILLTTHNPNILAELSDERTINIVKENKKSYVEEV